MGSSKGHGDFVAALAPLRRLPQSPARLLAGWLAGLLATLAGPGLHTAQDVFASAISKINPDPAGSPRGIATPHCCPPLP
jgi:hypothetical protein